jgi:predicted O-linked N-acetylglucosamine transferase (SPINDLY family)
MQQVTPEQAMQIAIAHHQAGRLADAEGIYRQVLALQPDRFDALHLLGVVAFQAGRNDAAVEMIGRAITLSPNVAEAHYNLGNALMAQGKFQQAGAAFARAIEMNPQYAEAINNLGNSLDAQGMADEAAIAYERAIQFRPDFAEAHFNLANMQKNRGKVEKAAAGYVKAIQLKPDYADAYSHLGDLLRRSGMLDEAMKACARAVELKPDLAEAYNNLGNVMRDQGKVGQAVAAYSRAIELKPAFAEAHYNLGNVLREQGKLEEAIAAYGKAIAANAAFADAHYNLGNCFITQGRLDEAVAAYSAAIRVAPGHAESHHNLAAALKEQGLIEQALPEYDRAIALKPAEPGFGSNRLYALHFHPGYDAAMIGAEHRRWNQQHAAPLRKPGQNWQSRLQAGPASAGSSAPRLRIGYVSPDFCFHSVGRFLLPLLQHRDRNGFEVYCYSDVRTPDVVTERLQGFADQWRNILDLSDEQAAELIGNDKIDILVDLAMHTAGNRLLVFARKPAPVQVTYLAYCSTTGLDAIDYRITDRFFDPPGTSVVEKGRGHASTPGSGAAPLKAATADTGRMPVPPNYSEKSVWLPRTYWCYEQVTALETGPLPALAAGHVTFGCLNNFAKVSASALGVWARVLRDTPGSRLVLHAPQGSTRQRVLDVLKGAGVAADRVTFTDRVAGQDYFQLYQSIDIGLDPFPFAGGTTTCDAVWMGIPVVTLAGKTAVGRAGASILSNLGLAGLIARSEEQYARLALELAKDLRRLSSLRAGLREKMLKSPLMDGPALARDLEEAFRQMWREARAG